MEESDQTWKEIQEKNRKKRAAVAQIDDALNRLDTLSILVAKHSDKASRIISFARLDIRKGVDELLRLESEELQKQFQQSQEIFGAALNACIEDAVREKPELVIEG